MPSKTSSKQQFKTNTPTQETHDHEQEQKRKNMEEFLRLAGKQHSNKDTTIKWKDQVESEEEKSFSFQKLKHKANKRKSTIELIRKIKRTRKIVSKECFKKYLFQRISQVLGEKMEDKYEETAIRLMHDGMLEIMLQLFGNVYDTSMVNTINDAMKLELRRFLEHLN